MKVEGFSYLLQNSMDQIQNIFPPNPRLADFKTMKRMIRGVLLSNRMTSGIHTHSDSGVGIVILREFRDLEKLLLNMSTLTI